MFMALPDQSNTTNRQNSPRYVDWCHENALGVPGTYLTLSDPTGAELPDTPLPIMMTPNPKRA